MNGPRTMRWLADWRDVGRMVDRTDTFLREVDEELRREQLQKLWERYGMLVVGAAVLLLAAVGGYKWWESRRIAANEAAGARFEAASKLIADGKTEDGLKELGAIAQSGSAGYRTLARLQAAGASVKDGKSAQAIADLDALAKDAGIDPTFRDLAALQAAMLRVDGADWTEMENRLTPLMGEKAPWRSLAREALGLAAYKAGKLAEARKLFEEIVGDPSKPPTVGERAMLMLALLTDAEGSSAPAPAGVPVKVEEAPKAVPGKGDAPAAKGPAGKAPAKGEKK